MPFGVGVNSCYCVGCEIIKGAAALDKLLYGATGGLDLRHRYYRYTGFPFLIARDVDCFRLAVSAPCPRYRKRTRRHTRRCCPAPRSRCSGGSMQHHYIALTGRCEGCCGCLGADRIMTGPQARHSLYAVHRFSLTSQTQLWHRKYCLTNSAHFKYFFMECVSSSVIAGNRRSC